MLAAIENVKYKFNLISGLMFGVASYVFDDEIKSGVAIILMFVVIMARDVKIELKKDR